MSCGILAAFLSCLVSTLNFGTIADSGPDAKILDWSTSRKLVWSDFQATPDLNSNHAALTTYQIGFTYIFEDDGKIEFLVRCQFIRNNSWVKRHARTDYILNHEQKHFDLSEIYARKLRKLLSHQNLKGKKLREVDKIIDQLYNQVWNELDKAQQDYDRDCDHGILEKEQAEWDKTIARLLKETSGFESNRVIVAF